MSTFKAVFAAALALTAAAGTPKQARAEVRPNGAIVPVACSHVFADLRLVGASEYCIARGPAGLYLSVTSGASWGRPQTDHIPLTSAGNGGMRCSGNPRICTSTPESQNYFGYLVDQSGNMHCSGTPRICTRGPVKYRYDVLVTFASTAAPIPAPGRPGMGWIPANPARDPRAMPTRMYLMVDGLPLFNREIPLHPMMISQ